MAKDVDAVVIGGGIGGLSTAIALRRIGMEVSVFERMPRLTEVGSGLTLWTNAMRALDRIGVGDVIAARGGRVDDLENRLEDGDLLSTLPVSEIAERYGRPGYGLARPELQEGLASVLPPDSIHLRATCTGYRQDREGVTALFADGGEVRADVLIGADGIGSAVRKQMLGDEPPRYAGYTCWRSAAKVDHELLHPTTYIQLYGRGSNFGIFPVGPGMWSWYGTHMTGPTTTMTKGPEMQREALDQFRCWYTPVSVVIEATAPEACVRQDIYDRKPVARYVDGRVGLLGDAAHPTTPTLGQGGCMAIEDAVAVAKELAMGGDIAYALRRYNDNRRERTSSIVNSAWRQGQLYHGKGAVTSTVRNLMFGKAPVSAAMRVVDKLMRYEV